MQQASLEDRTTFKRNFGENKFLSGYFQWQGRRSRDFVIMLRVSIIGQHRPFGIVVSRGADSHVPANEIELRELVGRSDVALIGAFRVDETPKPISNDVYIFSANDMNLGKFDVPPLASFYINTIRDMLPGDRRGGRSRIVQYFFCVPKFLWPESAGEVFLLEGDGSFAGDEHKYRYTASRAPIALEIFPFARYAQRDFGPAFGTVLHHDPLAKFQNLGEQSTTLIWNAPQTSVTFSCTSDELDDMALVQKCGAVASALELGSKPNNSIAKS